MASTENILKKALTGKAHSNLPVPFPSYFQYRFLHPDPPAWGPAVGTNYSKLFKKMVILGLIIMEILTIWQIITHSI